MSSSIAHGCGSDGKNGGISNCNQPADFQQTSSIVPRRNQAPAPTSSIGAAAAAAAALPPPPPSSVNERIQNKQRGGVRRYASEKIIHGHKVTRTPKSSRNNERDEGTRREKRKEGRDVRKKKDVTVTGSIHTPTITISNGRESGMEHTHTPKKKKKRVKIMRDHFPNFAKDSQAAKFKVHKPQCTCGKVKALAKTDESLSRSLKSKPNEFVILPDIKSIKSIFVAGSAPAESFARDPLECERTLIDFIFPPATATATAPDADTVGSSQATMNMNNQTQIKVSSAGCMLESQPNGFVCIASTSKAVVDDAKNRAQKSRQMKIDRDSEFEFHPDHADYICTLHQSTLQKSIRNGKTNNKNQDVDNIILKELQHQGVEVNNSEDDGTEHDASGGSDSSSSKPTIRITIGHHLKTMLTIMKGQENYIFAMVSKSFKKGVCILEIDLPGGKRHLGETSFDCAVRETEEETSLLIDKTWLIGNGGKPVKSKSKSERHNAFYLVRPPLLSRPSQKDNVEGLLDNVFWTNTGISS